MMHDACQCMGLHMLHMNVQCPWRPQSRCDLRPWKLQRPKSRHASGASWCAGTEFSQIRTGTSAKRPKANFTDEVSQIRGAHLCVGLDLVRTRSNGFAPLSNHAIIRTNWFILDQVYSTYIGLLPKHVNIVAPGPVQEGLATEAQLARNTPVLSRALSFSVFQVRSARSAPMAVNRRAGARSSINRIKRFN
jgi:hypothetical protein